MNLHLAFFMKDLTPNNRKVYLAIMLSFPYYAIHLQIIFMILYQYHEIRMFHGNLGKYIWIFILYSRPTWITIIFWNWQRGLDINIWIYYWIVSNASVFSICSFIYIGKMIKNNTYNKNKNTRYHFTNLSGGTQRT